MHPSVELALRARGETVETVKTNTTLGRIVSAHGVPACAEFKRIDALPRRIWTDSEKRYAVKHMTAALKTRAGTQVLWPDQAVALVEAYEHRGLIGGIRVSGGKSLIAYLSPTALSDCPRPLLIVPSKSIKTKKIIRTWNDARKHWRLRKDVQWIAYDTLQTVNYVDYLIKYQPGLLVFDEAQHAGRYSSSRSTRVERLLEQFDVPVIALSGSLIASHVVDDSARLCNWALGPGSPLPRPFAKATRKFWAMALEYPSTLQPGALRRWAEPKESTLSAVGRRYITTPGVVVSSGEALHSTKLALDVEYVDVKDKKILKAFDNIRRDKLPNGRELLDSDGSARWVQAQTVALGFYYELDPEPPADWLDAYRSWCSYCREVISDGKLDTEKQVKLAIQAEVATGVDEPWPYTEWMEIAHTHKHVRKTVWLSDERVRATKAWMRAHPYGIVWTQFGGFGNALAPYYASGGREVTNGRLITDHKRGSACVASIKVCSEDLNLQHTWHEALFPSPPATGAWHEQAIAREHRFGQPQPLVRVTYQIACHENNAALDVAIRCERAAATMTHDDQRKLLIGKWTRPKKSTKRSGPQWVRTLTNESVMT